MTHGMESVVDKFYQGYGDQQPFNKDGINQGTLQQRGNEYLRYVCLRTPAVNRRFFQLVLVHAREVLWQRLYRT